MKHLVALLACAALLAPAYAQQTPQETFKKAEDGAGRLFQGMGQEIKKAQDSMSKSGKKDEKKVEKKPEKAKEEKK